MKSVHHMAMLAAAIGMAGMDREIEPRVIRVGDGRPGRDAPPAPRKASAPIKREPTAYDLARIARAEQKRARKAAKRAREQA